jgi:ATP-dependent Lon protease
MTGEITIRGNVLPIGGLREKTMAAYSAGVRTIIIPADNLKDLHEVDPVVRENVTFIPCSRAHEVLSNALVRENAAVAEKATPATVEDVVITSNTSKAPAERRAKSEK